MTTEFFAAMTLSDALLVAAGAFVAGGMNAIAGGGTFFSFPALLAAGVPPVMANASNTVALWPASLASAWAYRKEAMKHGRWAYVLSGVALGGGLMGGLLLLATSDAAFSKLIPWLLLLATVLFAFSKQVSALVARIKPPKNRSQLPSPPRPSSFTSGLGRTTFPSPSGRGARGEGEGRGERSESLRDSDRPEPGSIGGAFFQLLVGIYGGFFGAGMGILTLAALSIQGYEDMQELNALKNLTSGVNYTVAALTFIFAGAISWPHTLLMLATAMLGGYAGAALAKRLPSLWLRRIVITVGTVLTVLYFNKTYF